MVKKTLTFLILIAVALPAFGKSREEFAINEYDRDDVLYSYEAPNAVYFEESNTSYSFDDPACRTCRERPGISYYNSKSIACYTTGLVIGIAVIAGMVAIVVNQSHCSHSH